MASATTMRLTLVGVGPQRTGTSWLYECLRRHPQLRFPAGVKETMFLDERFDEGWTWYWSHFNGSSEGALLAEIGASYFDRTEVTSRLRDHNPDCRIIVTLRDPAARSFSLYLHHRKRGRLDGSFGEAVRRMPRIIDASRYRVHLERWMSAFGREQVLVLLAEDMAASPEEVLASVYAFASIRPVSPPSIARERVNVASLSAHPAAASLATKGSEWLRRRRLYAPVELAKRLGLKRVYTGQAVPALDRVTREGLIHEFAADIAYVEELLQRPLPEWRRA